MKASRTYSPVSKVPAPCRENPDLWTADGVGAKARLDKAAQTCRTMCTLYGTVCSRLTRDALADHGALHGAWDGQVYGLRSATAGNETETTLAVAE